MYLAMFADIRMAQTSVTSSDWSSSSGDVVTDETYVTGVTSTVAAAVTSLMTTILAAVTSQPAG